jgi:hypothetical protein
MIRVGNCIRPFLRFSILGALARRLSCVTWVKMGLVPIFSYFCGMKRTFLWIILGWYGLFSLAPTLYIHECCCGVVEQWMFPPAACCEQEDGHQHNVHFDCCNEQIVSFHLSANQLPSYFQLTFFAEQVEKIYLSPINALFSSLRFLGVNKTENPPPLLRRFIKFRSLKIFDVLHGLIY